MRAWKAYAHACTPSIVQDYEFTSVSASPELTGDCHSSLNNVWILQTLSPFHTVQVSSHVLHHVASADFNSYHLQFGSTYIADKVYERLESLGGSALEDWLRALTGISTAAALRGAVFER